MNLVGTKKYIYGRTKNPVTDKQQKILNAIEYHLGVKFTGKNSKEAYSFISKYHPLIE